MKKKSALFIFLFFLSAVCFAQADRNESITFATYYPSPHGVYKTLRLYPTNMTSLGSEALKPGAIIYDDFDKKLYIYNDSGFGGWEPIGSGSNGTGSSVILAAKIQSGHKVWPDVCPGILEMRTFLAGSAVGTQASICSEPWLKKITFNQTFSNIPEVFVSAETLSGSTDDNQGDYYTCGEHSTDALRAYAENVTTSGFDLRIGSSAQDGSSCCHGAWGECTVGDDWKTKDYYGKGEAAWLAIGE